MLWHWWEIKPEPNNGETRKTAVEWMSQDISTAQRGKDGTLGESKTAHCKFLFMCVFWGQRK